MGTARTLDLGGPVHVVDHGGRGRPIVLVHGLGGSHVNWSAVADRLTVFGRVLAPDLAGFGFTPPWGRSSDLEANRDLLDRIITATADEPAVLVGNSMGGLISMMEAAARPEHVAGLVLADPAIPPRVVGRVNAGPAMRLVLPTLPFVGPLGARLYLTSRGIEGMLDETLDFVCADKDRVAPEDREAATRMATERMKMPWAMAAFADASRSIIRFFLRPGAYEGMVDAIRAPTLLLHGDADELVLPDAARWLARRRPDWEFHLFGDVGHAPQLEAPDAFLAVVGAWMDDLEAAPVTGPRMPRAG